MNFTSKFKKITKEKPLTIGQKRLRMLIFIIITATILSIGMIIYKAVDIHFDMMASIVEDKSKQAANEVDRFIDPVFTILTTMQQWGKMGLFDTSDSTALTRKIIPFLDHEQLSHISALMVADNTGTSYMLMRENEKWISRLTRADTIDKTTTFQTRVKTEIIDEWQKEIDFDPRNRIWFEGAIGSSAKGIIFWSPPYIFFTLKEPGITASISVIPDNKKETTQVIALDILLKDFQNRLERLSLPESARIFLINENNTVSNLSAIKNADLSKQAHFNDIPQKKQPDKVILSMLNKWKGSDKAGLKAFAFNENGTKWWGSVASSRTSTGIVNIGIAISGEDLTAAVKKRDFLFIILSLAVLCAGAILVTLIARAYERELVNIAARNRHADDTEEELKMLISGGESARLEFKSTLRWNLATDKPGKEIEIACIKTVVAFLNSEGGTLLVGVKDDGEILGIGADNFANEDKYLLHFNNLINQHIGLEFSRLISFNLKSIGDKQIFVVDCDKSDEPVFVTNKDTEDFYIRVGPGSKKLPTSTVLEYLKNR